MNLTLPGGLLVAFEGIDGSGKSTQWRRLTERLREEKYRVVALVEPTRSPTGLRIREMATLGRQRPDVEREIELFLEDRRWNVTNNIVPALGRGEIVLLDRYYYSSIAYQGARGVAPEVIRQANEAFAPPADLILYFDIPLEIARDRLDARRAGVRDLFEGEAYLAQVRQVYETLTDPQRVRIDATQPEEAVFQEAWQILFENIEARAGGKAGHR